MKQLTTALFVSFMALTAMAQQNNEIPLPPPIGPGGGNPGVPQPPRDSQPPAPPAPGEEQPVPPPAYGGQVAYTVGAATTISKNNQDFAFRPAFGLDRLTQLRITATSKKVTIESVKVVYAGGMGAQVVYGLSGFLREGQGVTATLQGASIESIIVTAASSSFWKSTGAFRVDAVAIQAPAQQPAPIQ